MWLIYVSEIASAIGKNKYQPRWKTLFKVWKRLDYGKPFQQSVERYTKKQETSPIIHTQHMIKHILQPHFPNSSQLTPGQMRFQTAVSDFQAQVQRSKLHTKSPSEIQTMVEEFQQNLERSKKDLPSSFHTYVNEVKKELSSHPRVLFGTQEETKQLQNKDILGHITDNNTTFFKRTLGLQPVKWGIGGRIDGFRDGVLIEIKNRVRGIWFDGLPEYDMIQVQSYMELLDEPKVCFIQKHEDQVHETMILRDPQLWKETILPRLEVFVRALHMLVENHEIQEEFLGAPPNRKYIVANRLFQQR